MALGVVLAENKYSVVFWDIDQKVIAGINEKHKNPRSLPDVKLDKSVSAEPDILRAVFGADMVVFAVASGAVREVALRAKDALARNCVIITIAKGLEEGTLKTMVQVLRDALGARFDHQIAALSGPTLAPELANKKPTAAMLASAKSNAYIKRAVDAFSNDWFRIYETRDVVGVELAGVVKHAIAIASGITVGLGYADNTRAWILTEGFREMARLIWKLGGQEETVYGLSGLGDALGTSLAAESRNVEFGTLLGKGKTVAKAREIVGQTVEGITAVDSLYKLSVKEKLNLPLLRSTHEVVTSRKKVKQVFEDLIRNM